MTRYYSDEKCAELGRQDARKDFFGPGKRVPQFSDLMGEHEPPRGRPRYGNTAMDDAYDAEWALLLAVAFVVQWGPDVMPATFRLRLEKALAGICPK